MHLSDHSLGQLDADYLQRLEVESLRGLSLRLLEDLKEARERLGQNPTNSSRPPSSQAPWDRPSARDTDSSDDEETPLLGENPDQPADNGASPEDESEPTPPPPATGEGRQAEPPKRKPGKQPGAPGFGRTQVFKAHETIAHCAETCAACAGRRRPECRLRGFPNDRPGVERCRTPGSAPAHRRSSVR